MEKRSILSLTTICSVFYIGIGVLVQNVCCSTSIVDKTSLVKKTGEPKSRQDTPEVREGGDSYGHEDDYYANVGYDHGGGVGYGQSKGYGGGGGGYGHGGGHGHGAITLDPVSIISLLALGAFLINNILQLLRTNMQTGRSLSVRDIDVPLDLSDWSFDKGSNLLSEPARNLNDDTYGPSFSKFFANVGSLYYLHPKKRNMCIRKVVCNYMTGQQAREDSKGTLRNRVFEFMLSTITRLVAPEIKEQSKMGLCQQFNKYCSDAVLHDAKISTENKVYSTVTSIVSNAVFQRLFSG